MRHTPDWEAAYNLLYAVGADTSEEFTVLTIPGAPWSKSRPRFARRTGRAYTPQADLDAESYSAGFLSRAVPQPFPGNVAMACLFFRPNRQRIDTDNLLKHVCDSANGILWQDDSQCTALAGVLNLDHDNPRTVVAVARHTSSLTRGSDDTVECLVCGTPVSRRRGGRLNLVNIKTCSRECAAKARGYELLDTRVPCKQCGELFQRKTKSQRLCSPECRVESQRAQRRAAAKPNSKCVDCSKQLAHKRGGRCRDCWKANVAKVLPDG